MQTNYKITTLTVCYQEYKRCTKMYQSDIQAPHSRYFEGKEKR